eukprot:4126467-Amphidinium_carterae.1
MCSPTGFSLPPEGLAACKSAASDTSTCNQIKRTKDLPHAHMSMFVRAHECSCGHMAVDQALYFSTGRWTFTSIQEFKLGASSIPRYGTTEDVTKAIKK